MTSASSERIQVVPSVWEEIRRRSLSKPDEPAILSPHRSPVSFRQLWSRMGGLTECLREAGVGPDTTIAVVLPEGPHFLATILAVSRRSACAPINPALTASELEAYLREIKPDALLVAPEFPAVAEVGRRLGLTVFEAHEENVGSSGEWKLLAMGSPKESKRPGIAVLLQTSATTGRSKLVGLSRANLQASMASTRLALRLSERDRVLLLSPLFHLQGILSAMSQMAVGGSAIALCVFDRGDFVWWLDRFRPTWYTCGPTMHRALCSLLEGIAPRAAGLRPHSLRFVRSIGAPLSPDLADHLTRVLGAPVLNGYGMTETGVVTSMPLDCAQARTDSVGKSTGPEIQIWNRAGHEMAPGDEGEIVLRAPSVMAGYLNDVEANRRSFKDGWFRTGDLGRLDKEGFLYVTGRLKEQINRGGEKIHPAEVDDAIALHPGVEGAATFAIAHASLGEDVACAVVLRSTIPTPSAEDLRRFAAERLAPFKVPRQIFFVESIPRGATGKPQRHLLFERFTSTARNRATDLSPRPEDPARPLNAIEQQILKLWRQLLGRDDLTPDADFFDAGGDSMGAVAMLSEIEQITGLRVVLSSESFFDNATVFHLAEMIQVLRDWEEENSPSAKIVVIPLQGGGATALGQRPRTPLYLFPANSNDGTTFRRLAQSLGPEWPVSLVRPGHMRHRDTADVIEDAAKDSVAAIRADSPEGPYLLGGFCFGGVIAFEAARLLEKQGCKVALILFDTPAPGFPQFFWQWRHAHEHLQLLRKVAWEMRRKGQARPYVVLLVRKLAWNAILLVKPLYRISSRWAPVRWIATRAKTDDLPFFRLRRTQVPVLHLRAIERPNVIVNGAYAGWNQVVESGVTEFELPGNHATLFSRANMSRIAEAIQSWVVPQVIFR